MNVTFHPDVYKQLQQLPRQVFSAALNAIIDFSHDPLTTQCQESDR